MLINISTFEVIKLQRDFVAMKPDQILFSIFLCSCFLD